MYFKNILDQVTATVYGSVGIDYASIIQYRNASPLPVLLMMRGVGHIHVLKSCVIGDIYRTKARAAAAASTAFAASKGIKGSTAYLIDRIRPIGV